MKNILIIRRDNIGDLVCTTPLIEGAKIAYPDARLFLLVNKVTEDVVKHNPHIDRIFVYKKSKHRANNESALSVHFQRLKMFIQLRKIKFDAVILANPVPCKYSLRLAKMAGARHIIGADSGDKAIEKPFRRSDFKGKHQVEHAFSYLSAISDKPQDIPPVHVYLTEEERHDARTRLQALLPDVRPLVAIHISSRSAKRRWPVERYAEIIQRLQAENNRVLIFWSPQGTLGPDDIGDEERARQLLDACDSRYVALYPTASIRELMAGFDLCQRILCSDGGQMHIAAGLGKPQVVFFGDTDKDIWHPWSGEYHILQSASGDCVDITVDETWQKLQLLQSNATC